MLRLAFLSGVLVACGSGSDAPPVGGDRDGGSDGSIGGPCVTAADCDDGVHCNGTESCAAGACAGGAAVDCDDGQSCTEDRCSESERACRHDAPDADGDGHGDESCTDAAGMPLGDDCEDANPRRHPG